MDPLPPFPWIDVVIIVVLFALNGVFAMSELALVSSRRARLEAMAKGRSRGASAARCQLAWSPIQFTTGEPARRALWRLARPFARPGPRWSRVAAGRSAMRA